MRSDKDQARLGLVFALALALCTTPSLFAQSAGRDGAEWISVDPAAGQVKLELVAGMTDENIRWNFNGYFKGAGRLTIPLGYRVVIEFRNDDPLVAHSIGLGEVLDPFPPMFTDPQPVFAGAMSSSPTSMTEGTMPGQTETLEFTVDRTGTYALICHMPAHAVSGMWLTVEVVESGRVRFDAAR